MANDTPHGKSQVLTLYLERRKLERLLAEATDAERALPADLVWQAKHEADLVFHKVKGAEEALLFVECKRVAKPPRPARPQRLPKRIQRPPGTHLAKCGTFLL